MTRHSVRVRHNRQTPLVDEALWTSEELIAYRLQGRNLVAASPNKPNTSPTKIRLAIPLLEKIGVFAACVKLAFMKWKVLFV